MHKINFFTNITNRTKPTFINITDWYVDLGWDTVLCKH